ncbi:uncharacterized protein LOC141705196 [Apium graveolens]|uniref:uncharacterized protein LOC141705196 n=1 Tax=Apium graveolens TaxID=4045 RepID=UPI003D79DC26
MPKPSVKGELDNIDLINLVAAELKVKERKEKIDARLAQVNDAIYLVRCLMKKYQKRHKNIYMVFIDLEKAYDSVSRAIIWRYLEAQGVPPGYGDVIQDMYSAIMTEKNQEMDVAICILDDRVPQTDSFKYMGFIIKSNGDILADVTHRIKASWIKWKAVIAFLCDKSVLVKLKDKFYRLTVRPTLMYGFECWPLKKSEGRKLETAELRMLR